MAADPRMVVVKEEFCNACGTPRVNVHHQSFPEMWIGAESAHQAAESLAIRLNANLDSVSDPSHRERVRRAIADVQAYLAKDVVAQPKFSEVITIRAADPPEPGARPTALARTETLEVRRLTLPKGREIPTHHAQGEIIVQCLEGRIAFTSGGTTREIGAGQLIVLAAGEPHSLVGSEDSTVLVTKVLPVRPSPAPHKTTARNTG
jgi:quercetin dioxygenase-like cupin family protein